MGDSTTVDLDKLNSELGSEEDSDPPTRFLATILSDLKVGRVELSGDRLEVEGIADASKIESLKKKIETEVLHRGQTLSLKIEPPDRAPFHWAARKKAEGQVTLEGDVADERVRAKLVALAQGISEGNDVVDRMTTKREVLPRESTITETALAQFKVLRDGFAWIYGRRFDLIGSSHKFAGVRNGCQVMARIVPDGIECRFVQIAAWHYYTPARRGEHHYFPPRRIERHEESRRRSPYVPVKPAGLAPQAIIEKSYDPRVVDLFYATVRKPNENETRAVGDSYSGERDESLHFGRARVRVPEHHHFGRLELPGGFSILTLSSEQPDQNKHFILRSVQSLSQEQWDTQIDAIGPHEALVFVHGFRTTFDEAVYRFAQISFDAQFKGLPVLFSWASRGEVAGYEYDRNSALVAGGAFLDLLDNLKQRHGISTVHVIAHSMGNFLVLGALANWTKTDSNPKGQLIMAAADVDRDQFIQVVPKVARMFKGLTLYASSVDRALIASMAIAGGIPRAGFVPREGPIVVPGVETLDATALGDEIFGWNHNDYAEKRSLIDDIGLLLTRGGHAPRLPQVRPMPETGVARYWRFAP
ncbi:hypothetical protein MSC49_03400 [Methylosinus sp. C49]|nr:hypothetical protein MSC49_03400 [Methylosinus sp. C49]